LIFYKKVNKKGGGKLLSITMADLDRF